MIFNQTTNGTYGGNVTGSGTLTKQGAGTLTLSASNSYGNTVLQAGTLAVGDTNNLGFGTTIFDGGTLKIIFGNRLIGRDTTVTSNGGTFDNNGSNQDLTQSTIGDAIPLSHSTLTMNGLGITIVNSDKVTGLGRFVINGGTLEVNIAGTRGRVTNDITLNGGTLSLNGNTAVADIVAHSAALPFGGSSLSGFAPSVAANNATLSGLITGNGTITFNGSGTLTLSNPLNAFTGTLSATAGSTVFGDSSTITGNVNTNGTVTFNQVATGTFAGNITGSGVIVKTGAAPLTLTNTTSSAIDLQAGLLSLGAEGASGGSGTTTVSGGAIFGGNGTITGDLHNGGTVSPGFSPGTILVTGNYTQTASGNLVIQIASAASFDKLIITGSAALAGNLEVDSLGGFSPGGPFTILTAAGGLGGTTFTTTNSLTALTYTVTYDANDVVVFFSQANFNAFALTPNQFAVATAGQNSPALTTALNAVPTGQLPAAFNALSPQGYEIWSDIAFAHATALAGEMERPSEATQGHNAFYFDTGQNHGREGQNLDVGQSTFTSTDGLVGGDHFVSPSLTVGGFFAYGESDADLSQPGSSTKAKDYTLGARAVWNQGSWFAHGVAAYDFDRYHSTRPVVFPGTAATATSHTHGGQWTVGVSGGEHFTVKGLTLSPFASLVASGWQANRFTETGAGAFNLSVANESATSLRTQFGVDAETTVQAGSFALQPHLSAAWQHEFEDSPRQINAAFGPTAFAVVTRASQVDSAVLGGGLNVTLTPTAMLYSNFSLQTGSITKILGGWNVGVSVRF